MPQMYSTTDDGEDTIVPIASSSDKMSTTGGEKLAATIGKPWSARCEPPTLRVSPPVRQQPPVGGTDASVPPESGDSPVKNPNLLHVRTHLQDVACSADGKEKTEAPGGEVSPSGSTMSFSSADDSDGAVSQARGVQGHNFGFSFLEALVDPAATWSKLHRSRTSDSCLDAATINIQLVEAAKQQLPGRALTPWQARFCTPENITPYRRLAGRAGAGDGIGLKSAAGRLVETLQWREQFKEVLSGARTPVWQGDLRVLTRGEEGHPVIYLSFRHSPRNAGVKHTTEHVACVLEAATLAMRGKAQQLDFVCDCIGFQISNAMRLEVASALLKMFKAPYRGRLREGVIVDSPRTFSALWRATAGMMSEKTKKRISFRSQNETVAHFRKLAGDAAADVIANVMAANRSNQSAPYTQPSELKD